MWLLIHPSSNYAVTIKSEEYIKKWNLTSDVPELLENCDISYKVYSPSCDWNTIGTVYTKGKLVDKDNCIINIYSWDNLKLLNHCEVEELKEELFWFQSLAFSPDGKLIALASFNESLAIINKPQFDVVNVFMGGEWISGLTFDDSSSYLAAAHTFQGGGYISIYKRDGMKMIELHKELFWPPDLGDFADTYASMSFTHEGKYLVVCEISMSDREKDYSGNLLLYNTIQGNLIWNTRLIAQQGQEIYPTIAVSDELNTIFCGMDVGKIFSYNLSDGKYKKTYNTGISEPILAFSIDKLRKCIWIACENGDLIKLQL